MIEPLVRCCAGLDVHRATVVATLIREDEGAQIQRETREYGSFRQGVLELAGWLNSAGVELAVMERAQGCTGSRSERFSSRWLQGSTWSTPGM